MSLKILRRSLPNLGWGYGPPGEGPFPAIMLLHGSEGSRSGMIYRTAAVLAAHGFLAMAFPYSNGKNSGDIIDVPLDRTAEALSSLRAWSIAGTKVGLYGISRGAEHALLLASLMARDGVAGPPMQLLRILHLTLYVAHLTPGCGETPVIPAGARGTRPIAPGAGAGRRTISSQRQQSRSNDSMVRSFSVTAPRTPRGPSR